MKDKILPFIIGLLAGAIIATGGFLIYSKTSKRNSNPPEIMQMNGDNMQPPDNMGEPPAKPSGDNGTQPPAKPEDVNNNTNS